jgi:hypothetical protein
MHNKNRPKPQLMNQRVSIFSQELGSLGRTGQIKSCYDNGYFGVRLDGSSIIETFQEDELYFQDHPLGYNQPCFS